VITTLDIDRVLSELTLEEKASLTSGSAFWYTAPIDRLGIPKIMASTGRAVAPSWSPPTPPACSSAWLRTRCSAKASRPPESGPAPGPFVGRVGAPRPSTAATAAPRCPTRATASIVSPGQAE
jgi:hypothetical protein